MTWQEYLTVGAFTTIILVFARAVDRIEKALGRIEKDIEEIRDDVK